MGSCAVAVDSGGGGAEGLEHKAEGQGFILGTWGAKQKTMGTGQQGGPGVSLLWMATTSRQLPAGCHLLSLNQDPTLPRACPFSRARASGLVPHPCPQGQGLGRVRQRKGRQRRWEERVGPEKAQPG